MDVAEKGIADDKVAEEYDGERDPGPGKEEYDNDHVGKHPEQDGVEEEGKVAEAQGEEALQVVEFTDLDDVDIEDVDLHGAGENVDEGEEHGEHRHVKLDLEVAIPE